METSNTTRQAVIAIEILTKEMIVALWMESEYAGDTELFSLCEAALGGDKTAREACAAAITAARAMDESTPLIRVVVTNLFAHEWSDGWCVIDPDGGTWWPTADAQERIVASSTRASTALGMAWSRPLDYGAWHS